MKELIFLLIVQNIYALNALHAEGLVAYGFCTSASARNDCSWATNCQGVTCVPTGPSFGEIGYLIWKPANSDPKPFQGITQDFLGYFKNVSGLIINDTLVQPPVRWNLAPIARQMRNLDTMVIYSAPGRLYGTIPDNFFTRVVSLIIIDGELEGTIPQNFIESTAGPAVKLHNHRLVGTIPANLLQNVGRLFEIQSTQGQLVGNLPHALNCNVSASYTLGPGNNGGMFCECSTSCIPNILTGANMCYDYRDSSRIVDPCTTQPVLQGCANPKLTMRYGTLCYDVCQSGCPSGTACQVDISSGVPEFACLDVTLGTVTTPTTYESDTSGTTLMLPILLSLVL